MAMGAVKTIMWVVIAVGIALFSMANWQPVEVLVWPERVLETKLPVLIVIAFLAGAVPMWIMLRAARWSLTRRLDSSERQLADLRNMANRSAEATAPAPAPTTASGTLL
jgi:lipopolysaccharide assembly protein A